MSILGRVLKDRGVVTERQVQQAIQHQVLYGGRLGTSLYELGFITEERLQEALAKIHGIPMAASLDFREVQKEAVALLPKNLAAQYKICPFKVRGKTIFLLMVDPQDHGAVAKVSFSLGYIVKPLVVAEFRMLQLLRDHYGIDERWRFFDRRFEQAKKKAPEAPVLDRETATARLEAADSRDDVVAAVLGYCASSFRRVIFFIVREPWVLGWDGRGEEMDRRAAHDLQVPLDSPSIFQTVVRDRTPFVGRPGPEEENQRLMRALGKKPGTNVVVVPISVRSRVVNLVYGDNGPAGNVKADLGDLMVLVQKVPRAYLRIIRRRVAETRAEAGPTAGRERSER